MKLVNIEGNYNYGKYCEFNDNNRWQGQILLEDDGWFEEIAIESYTGNRFNFTIMRLVIKSLLCYYK